MQTREVNREEHVSSNSGFRRKLGKSNSDYVPGIYLTCTTFCGKISTRFKTRES